MNGKQLKNSILQWAIQGKLVPQDPNDEPASVLLDKIRQEKERLIKEKKIKRDKNASIIYRGEDNSYYEKITATGEMKCIDEEIPFEIPQGWEWCRFSSLYLSLTDGTHSTPKYTLTGVPFISVKDISSGIIDFSNTKYISKEEHQKLSDRCHPQKGDLLLSKVGTTGIPALVTTDKEFSLFVSVALIKLIQCDINREFLVFMIQSPLVQEQAKENTRGVGNKNWVLSAVSKTLMVVPPLEEQGRIRNKLNLILPYVERYSSSQDKLDLLNANIVTDLKKSILQEAIQGKLVPQIAEEGTAQELLEQIKTEKQKLVKEDKLKKSALASSVIFRGGDNKYWEKKGTTCECIDEDIPFNIPKSWAWARLETVLNTGSARRVHAKDWRQAGIPFYRAREIGKLADEGFVDNELYIDLSLYEDFSSSGVPLPNDLMITAVGTLGKVYIVKESDKFYYKDGSVLCLANKYGLCAEYLKMVIESPFFKGQYRQESQGTTVATLTMVRLRKYFIPIPPLQEQYRIVETYRNIASIMSR